ncbi:MAG: hypothetical protein LBR15_00930 [Methanobrevibacter sp.]|jgi:hypothetical protein|nr:hypothetical protein [Candidatus Methanovirga australis]
MTDPIDNKIVIDGIDYTVDDIKELQGYKNKYNSVMSLIVESFNFERFDDSVFDEFKQQDKDILVDHESVNTNPNNSIIPTLNFSVNTSTQGGCHL